MSTQDHDRQKKRGRQGESSGPVCGAKTRSKSKNGKPCQRPAGWGTDHLGYGTCKLHLGSTRQHTERALVEQMRDEMPIALLVRHVDRAVIRGVALRVLARLDLTLDQTALSRELLDEEIDALSVTVTRKQARRFAARAKARSGTAPRT